MNRYTRTVLYIGTLLLTIPSVTHAASLQLQSNTSTVNQSNSATVSVVLDTDGESVQAVDLVIAYDNTRFSIIDEDGGTSGTQIQNNSAFPVTITNSVSGGMIRLSHAINPPTSFSGTATIATFRVLGVTEGQGSFEISFTSGSTSDSNVASFGDDILSSVSNLDLTSSLTSSGSQSSGGGSSSSGGGGGGGGGGSTTYIPPVNQTGQSSQGSISGTYLKGISSPISISLYKGLTHADVTTLQRMLIAEGHLAYGNDTGYFGPLTEAAVQSFQRSRGIVSGGTPATTGYGVVGPMTRGYINARIGGAGSSGVSTAPSLPVAIPSAPAAPSTPSGGAYYTVGSVTRRTLSLGSEGFDVKALQRFLNLQGMQVAITGIGSLGNETEYFGPATRNAVIRFQNAYKAQILTPVGLSAGSGIVGPATWAMIEALR